jgi:cytochrome bd-type quinol oxidase subunit 1
MDAIRSSLLGAVIAFLGKIFGINFAIGVVTASTRRQHAGGR